jgi:hypothetical protein
LLAVTAFLGRSLLPAAALALQTQSLAVPVALVVAAVQELLLHHLQAALGLRIRVLPVERAAVFLDLNRSAEAVAVPPPPAFLSLLLAPLTAVTVFLQTSMELLQRVAAVVVVVQLQASQAALAAQVAAVTAHLLERQQAEQRTLAVAVAEAAITQALTLAALAAPAW